MYVSYLGILQLSYLFWFIFCLLPNLFSPHMAPHQLSTGKCPMCIFNCWSILSLSGLWLMCPDLVFILLFLLLWLLSWSQSLRLHILCYGPVHHPPYLSHYWPPTCQSEILFSCLPLWYAFTSVPAAYRLSILLCSNEFVSVNMSSNHPVPFTICFLRLPSTIIPCIHGPPSSPWTATAHPSGKEMESLWAPILFKYLSCHAFMASHFLSSVLRLSSSLLIWSRKALICLLDKSVAGLGNPAPISTDLICSKARLMSLLLYAHFYGTLHKLHACFHLTITLVVVAG